MLFDWVDAGLKVVIALIGIWISYLGYSYQKTSTASQLLVQQEKGDTEIRAQMFGKITDRLMKPETGESSLVQDALLAQVLALNFHELIELKPLMINLDSRLSRKAEELRKAEANGDELIDTEAARDSLRSVARRIRDRQVAALINNPRPSGDDVQPILNNYSDIGKIQYISALRSGKKSGKDSENSCQVKEKEGKNGCLREAMELPGPSENNSMYISIDKANWDKENFVVSFNSGGAGRVPKLPKGAVRKKAEECKDKITSNPEGGKQRLQSGHKSFELSWYDFPYTDNTLQANGDRYAIFIDRICKSDDSNFNSVRLGVLYFPKDYYPSRERPVSYNQIKKKMGWE